MESTEFARHGDVPLRLDLYRGPIGSPVVVYLHGGAWVVGTREDHRERLQGLADAGVTVASIDYRLAGEVPYPAQREDIEVAVDWIIAAGIAAGSADIVLMGASAGAHLAALTYLTSRYRFPGFVGLFGRYDLSSAVDHLRPLPGLSIPAEIIANTLPPGLETPAARLAALAGVSVDELSDEIALELSPVSHLIPGSPPMLLLHGQADALVHHDHAAVFAERAQHLGVPYEVVLIPDANHEDPLFDEPRYLRQIAHFVEQVTMAPEQK